MNKFKAIFCVCLCILTVGVFAACGDDYADSEYLGRWKCTTGEMSGVEINADEVLGGFTIELLEDGSAKVEIAGNSSEGKWEPEGDGFVIKGEGDSEEEELEFTKDRKDTIKVDYQGVTIKFKKE